MAPRRRTRAKSAEHQDAPRSEPVEVDVSMAQREALQSYIKAAELLLLAAVYSPISQLSLSPVYGSIPPSAYHLRMTTVAIFLAWAARQRIPNYVPKVVVNYLPVMAFSIPTIQFVLFKYSGQLGPVYGPLITELLTYFPLLFISLIGVSVSLDDFDWKRKIGDTMPAIASYGLFSMIQRASSHFISRNMGSSMIFTRSGLQFVVATFYALLLPSKFIVFAVLPLLHSAVYNPHIPLQQNADVLNSTLQVQGYSLVARQESLTGYISVLDNVKDGFRVLRCDHSLLGGEWLHHQDNPISKPWKLREPVYAIFVMLEAVRLVESQDLETRTLIPDNDKQALVIGLGIGTTPSALVAHGIHTTIIEIDPVVHEYATKYFNLPSNQTSIIEDAVGFVERAQTGESQRPSYHYIIHDVFTGGAEPAELFTEEFLQGLSNMLVSDGVIAINYAGDLLSLSARLVVHTVMSVFPSCRLFREEAGPSSMPTSSDQSSGKDFTNMVMFCQKTKGPFTFRDPVEADCLGSQARRYHLLPQHEINASYFDGRASDDELGLLRQGQTRKIEAFQRESAVGHWRIMRTVLPDKIWESW